MRRSCHDRKGFIVRRVHALSVLLESDNHYMGWFELALLELCVYRSPA